MKRKFQLGAALVLAALLPGFMALAQQTGSFNEDITFMGAQRQLACYVPADYDPATPTRLMIGLHGLGDNSNNYRNALVNSLGFATAVPNTILICPDGGSDALKDFYTPVGDEAIIEESIAYARTNYNIDTSEIVLQGFSLGGRSALRYGLLHTDLFKGLLLNTPAVQGVKEAVAQYAAAGLYDYDQAAHIPIYITHGNTDDLYRAPIDSTCEQLVRHDAGFTFLRFNGGHTIPAFAQIQDFNDFFEQPAANGVDSRIAKVTLSSRSCNTDVAAKVLVQNTGSTPLTNIGLSYEWNGTPQHYTWTGNLPIQGHTEVSLPGFIAPAGTYDLAVTVDTLNGNLMDTIISNNEASADFRIETAATTLPFVEHFDDNSYENRWLMQPSGDYIFPWTYDDEAQAMFCFNSIFVFDNSNRKEEMLSPVLDLSSLSSPYLTFDVAYNYTSFTASFFGVDTAFSDTLEVLVSTNCGDSYQSVYKKTGASLATFANPIVNPASLDAYFIVPADTNWRKETIDLSTYATSQDAVVKFRYTSALGGAIYLDNIAFVNEGTGIKETLLSEINLYPNPAADQVNLEAGNTNIQQTTIYDLSGRKMMAQEGNGLPKAIIATGSLPDGVYLFEIETTKGRMNKRVVIQH